jgi:hypothetical protein
MEQIKEKKVSETDQRRSNYKQLPGVVWKKHHVYEIEKRDGDVAMYRQIDRATNKLIGYEVFIVRKRKDRRIAGKIVVATECYPVNNDFGVTAYAPSTIEQAERRYQQLIDRVNARNKG